MHHMRRRLLPAVACKCWCLLLLLAHPPPFRVWHCKSHLSGVLRWPAAACWPPTAAHCHPCLPACLPAPSSLPAPRSFRHLMLDLGQLLPHGKKDAKLDTKSERGAINEVADLKVRGWGWGQGQGCGGGCWVAEALPIKSCRQSALHPVGAHNTP